MDVDLHDVVVQHDPYPSHGPFCCGCRRWISSQRQPSMTKLQLEVGQVYDSKLTGFISLFLIYLMSIHLTSCFTQFPQFWHLTLVCLLQGPRGASLCGFPAFLHLFRMNMKEAARGNAQRMQAGSLQGLLRGKLLSSDIIVTALDQTCLPGRINLSQGNFARLEVWVPTVGSPRTTLCCQVLFILLILFILFGQISRFRSKLHGFWTKQAEIFHSYCW